MVLKQWRVPRTLSFGCLRTNSRVSSSERAAYSLSVPYSRFPAQFLSFSAPAAQAVSREKTGQAMRPETSPRNPRLVIAVIGEDGPADSTGDYGSVHQEGRELQVVGPLRRKCTVTVMMIGVGTPLTSVGV